MKNLSFLLLFLTVWSCAEERVILLPEIENAEVTEVLDVSPAYLFYDETQPDSVFLNRKNLISTTNWLVNVDKRLTLGQAIPHIKFLQDKKRNAKMHKNENAKNYFTCNDTSIENLGFVEFTKTNYVFQENFKYYRKSSDINELIGGKINANIKSKDSIIITSLEENGFIELFNQSDFFNHLVFIQNQQSKILVFTNYNPNISFQDYILFKKRLMDHESENITIDNNEFIY
ncbi:MAG: hypothetical protein AAF901_08630 [Bacteroidota bacterium]